MSASNPSTRVLALILCLLSSARREATGATGATIGLNFTGSTQDTGGHYVWPPDTMGAVGGDYIVEMLNNVYSVYDKPTGRLLQRMPLVDFWTQSVSRGESARSIGFALDSRIVYDPSAERWYAETMDNTNGRPGRLLLVGVSDTSDPTSGWKALTIDGNPSDSDNRFEDFPILGFDADGVYVTSLLLNPEAAPLPLWDVMVLSIPKADLVAPNPTLVNRTLFDVSRDDAVARGGLTTMHSVIDGGAHSGGTSLFSVNGTLGLERWELTNSSARSPDQAILSAGVSIPIEPFKPAPSGKQPEGAPAIVHNGGGLSHPSGDPYDLSNVGTALVRQGDSIWGALHIDVGGRAGIRWYELDAKTNVVHQEGTISDPQLDLIYPSMSANPFGDVVIGFTATGEHMYPSAYAVVGKTAGGVTTFGDLMELKAGNGTYDSVASAGINRWGDYSTTVVDPNDPYSFWTFQEFTQAKNQWAVQVTQILLPGAAPRPDTIAVAPAAAYSVSDRIIAGVADGTGDVAGSDANRLLQSSLAAGEVDVTSNRFDRLITKFELPDRFDASHLLQHATLRVFLERIQGTPPGPLSLFHSVIDNRLTPLKSDYEDPSYIDTQLTVFQPLDAIGKFYDLDVTDLVRADYAQDGTHAYSAFRLQINSADFLEDNVSHRYFVTSSGTGRPELLLSFVPEPSTSILALGSLCVIRTCGRRRHCDCA